ncbi:hypothetical protein QYE76_065420 [Lolium multiflorum]|uniref:Uncharacterized protein n=1 Tax=Lolium multiflorum TaxID=4521 RepID=A0AAD8W9Z6_LOLMU|nr:hypothetical protein QYE76_065420 [Lolium multiflorum]
MSAPVISLKTMSGVPSLGQLDEDKLDLIGERWAVKYSTTLQQKCKSIYSGNILLHVDRRRLVLLDAEGTTVDAKIVPPDFLISLDLSLEFPCHLVKVVEQISRLSATDRSYSEVLQSAKPSPRERRSDDATSIWKVTYSTRKDLDRGRMKSYDGSLRFWSSNGWLVLINARDEPIAVQVLRSEPCYTVGSKVPGDTSSNMPRRKDLTPQTALDDVTSIDYRNNLDIANAVSTFGQYHTWNSNDPVKDRVLVYASFPSPQLVPRDVVFGKFATIGGVKESWTAPVYILSADFAEALPADADPMPLDGNPHPFPGELVPNQNLFVNPQYPEIGWDEVQHFPDNEQAQEHGDLPEQVDDLQQQEQESMVVNLSDSSGSSVNMLAMDIPQQQ